MLDGVGAGELPDAAQYGDQGSDTLGHIAQRVPLKVPTLRTLGLDRVAAIGRSAATGEVAGAFGRMGEASAGKDSVTGHWEMMGVVLERPFAVFPDGFAAETIAQFSRADRARGDRQQGGLGDGHHRRARRRADANRRADRVHLR